MMMMVLRQLMPIDFVAEKCGEHFVGRRVQVRFAL